MTNDFIPTPGPKDADVVNFLCQGDAINAGMLESAFTTAAQPWDQGVSLQELSDAYCVTPDLRVLTASLEWIAAGEISVGDELIGFSDRQAHGRNWLTATVTAATIQEAPVYETTLSDGTTLRSTGEHRWLRRGRAFNPWDWIRTDRITSRSTFTRMLPTWEGSRTYESGWLAGFFDGEGSLVQGDNFVLSASQKPGPTMELAKTRLDMEGFEYRETSGTNANQLILRGTKEAVRFLGQSRPSRLLPKFRPEHMGRITGHYERLSVVSVVPIGVREIAAISTDVGTYLVEGFGSHNTTASYFYAVSKDRKRRARNDGAWGDEEVLKAQLSEDMMEALVKALDKSLMVAMALAKRA